MDVVDAPPPEAQARASAPFDLRALLALYAATVAVFCDMYVTQPLLPMISRDFRVPPAVAGTTISAVVLTIALSSSLYGPLSDVIGRKPILVASGIALSFATLLCTFAPTLHLLLAARALQGLVIPGISTVAIVYIAETFGDARSGALMGGYIGASVLGGLLGRVLTGIIADRFAWQTSFAVFAALTLGASIAMALTLRATPPRTGKRLRDDVALSYRAMFSHLRDVRLIGAFIVGSSVFFGFVGIFTYLPYYLTSPPFSLSTGAVSWFYCAYIVGLVVAPGAGRLSSRVPRRTIMAAGVLLVIAGAAASLDRSIPVVVAAIVTVCSGMFAAQAVAPAFVNRTATRAKGGANALYQTFYYVGAVFGSTLPGLAWQRWAWPGVVATCIASSLVALAADGLLCGARPSGDSAAREVLPSR